MNASATSTIAALLLAATVSAQADWTDLTATVTGTTFGGAPGIPTDRLRGSVAL